MLQEQSQRPAFEAPQVEREVFPYALQLDRMIHQAQPKANTVFCETWGRKDGDASNCKAVPAVCSYKGMQARLSRNYAELAKRNSAMLAPVGTAWSRLRQRHPELELYTGDGVHPSARGSYLAACVFYATLLRKRVVGADRANLDAGEARILQQAADEAVFGPAK